jgi:tungstate transport system ATP-binding protein
MTAYTLSKVTKTYGSRTVLNIDSLSIEKGRMYALLGPNGAGKTTLLNILGFLDTPTSGKITYDSVPVRFSETYLQPCRKKVILVNQHPILFTTSVYKNVEFGLKVRRVSKKLRAQIIEESLEVVGMRHMAQAQAHKLSGGETQRVAIARALALSPQVILCDEPLSSVDLENQVILINLLRRINKEKEITLVFTSHDKLQAASLAHRSLFLDHGKLEEGSYENLFSAHLTAADNGNAVCSIQKSVQFMVKSNKTGQARLLIDPEKICVLEGLDSGHRENCLKGNVVQVADEKGRIRLVVESDIYLTLLMNFDTYRNQHPMVGDLINVHIPNEAINIL